jgi:hypothetical protein
MNVDDLMNQFAELVGRAMARRWLRRCGVIAPPGHGPKRRGRGAAKAPRQPAAGESASDKGRHRD